MAGVQEYNASYENMAKKKVKGIRFMEEFYNFVLLNHSSSTTYMYIHNVMKFMDTIDKHHPSKITFPDYIGYFASIKDKSGSHQTVVYQSLKLFSKFLKISKYVKEDYLLEVDPPNKKESAETKMKRENDYLTIKEMKDLYNKVLNSNKNSIWKSRDLAMVRIMMTTGIRRAALQKLDLQDIDLESQEMVVTEKRGEVRKIALSDDTVKDIRIWMTNRSVLEPDTDAVFISVKRTRVTLPNINFILKQYDPDIHPHELRASYGTALYKKSNGDLYFVQKNMGHASPAMTERYIRGNNEEASKRAAKIMGDLF